MNLKGIIKEYSLFFISIIIAGILLNNKQNQSPVNINNILTPIVVRVTSYPRYRGVHQEFYVQFNNNGISQKLKLIIPVNRQININDILYIKGKIKDRYPNSFSYINNPDIVLHYKGDGLIHEISNIRTNLLTLIQDKWHGQNAALFSGLLIGADYDYSEEITEKFKTTLTMHILVVSGFNIDFLHKIIMQASVMLGRRKTYLVSVCILIFYSLIVGIDNIPCQRALIMTISVIIAKLFERRVQGLQLWGITMIIVLLINPNNIHELSFQLSFIASFAMICAGSLQQRLKLNWVLESLMINLICNILMLPIIIKFGNIPSVGSLIANILISPLIPLVIVSGLISIITSIICVRISDMCILLTDLQLDLIFSIVTIANMI